MYSLGHVAYINHDLLGLKNKINLFKKWYLHSLISATFLQISILGRLYDCKIKISRNALTYGPFVSRMKNSLCLRRYQSRKFTNFWEFAACVFKMLTQNKPMFDYNDN